MSGKLGKLLLRRLEKIKFTASCTDDYWGEMIPEVLMVVKIFLVLKMALKWLKNPASSKSCCFIMREMCRCLMYGHVRVKTHEKNELLMTRRPTVYNGISAYLN